MEKKWKTPGDVILLHMCTINEDLMYGSWDIRCNGQISFVILGLFFCPLTPLTTQKIKILKNEKTTGYIIILNLCTTNDSQCVIPEIVRATDRHSCHFRVFFALLPHLQTQKSKFWKKWKKYLKILSFYTYLPQMTIIWYMNWDMECDRLNFLPFWTIFCPFNPSP